MASPTCTAAGCTSDWLSGAGEAALNLFRESSLSGNNTTVRVVPGPLRAARFLSFGRPSFLQGRNNSIRNLIKSFRGAVSTRLGSVGLHIVFGRAVPLSPIRDECRPVVTKILVGPDCGPILTNALCCTTGPIVTEKYNVIHASKIGMETYQRAVQSFPKFETAEGHQRNV